jgi:hypothetical protein
VTATAKMTLVHHKAGQVLGAVTRAVTGSKPAPADVAPDGFVLHRDTDYSVSLTVPVADLATTDVDLEPDVLFAPRRWLVVAGAATLASSLPVPANTIAPAAGVLSVSVTGTSAQGPKAKDVVSVVVENTTHNVHETHEAITADVGGGNTQAIVDIPLPSGTYNIVVFVPGFLAIFEKKVV